MSKPTYPSFNIGHLAANKLPNQLLNADRFGVYLSKNPHLQVVHSHSFYHLVYFTSGSGHHTIDFKTFPVQPGSMYFMRPGQVHNWQFEGVVDGYIVNFSPTYFDQLLISSHFVDQFAFFNPGLHAQVVFLSSASQKETETIFEKILQEQADRHPFDQVMIASLLIQLFATVARQHSGASFANPSTNHHADTVRQFHQLIETHFLEKKLPKEYAALLFVTPSHLNALCKEQTGLAAGDIIRQRILLEAKRMLVNFSLSVGDIAAHLNFADSSYFVKFFKKYTGATPENFRQQQYKNQ